MIRIIKSWNFKDGQEIGTHLVILCTSSLSNNDIVTVLHENIKFCFLYIHV